MFEWLRSAFQKPAQAGNPAPATAQGAPAVQPHGNTAALDKMGAAFRDHGQKVQAAFEPLCPKNPNVTPGWAAREGAPTTDVTGRFQEHLSAAREGRNTLPADAQEYVYLNVGGLFTDHYPGYMSGNADRMKGLGLDTRAVPIDSDVSAEENAKVIRDAVLDAAKGGKKVVLNGHSKGGVDITMAMSLYPELREHVHAVVAQQTPFGGSPIASDIAANPRASAAMGSAVKTVLGGNPDAMQDLTYERRKSFLAEHPYPTDVPTVSLATASDSPWASTAAAAAWTRARYGAASDGLVAQEDAVIPGSDVVRLSDMDHAAPAMAGLPGVSPYEPGDVQQALLALALEKAARQEANQPGAGGDR